MKKGWKPNIQNRKRKLRNKLYKIHSHHFSGPLRLTKFNRQWKELAKAVRPLLIDFGTLWDYKKLYKELTQF